MKNPQQIKTKNNGVTPELTYNEAVSELERILEELESKTEINMISISEKVKRAALLIDICKKQLHEIDGELEKILNALD